MPRYKLLIEYDGQFFKGWQRQADQPSVQGTLEAAIRALSGEVVTIGGAGRTDSGVHATGQVAHLTLCKDWEPERLCGALNFYLRVAAVAILSVVKVPDDFNARFSALARHYRYRIILRRAPLVLEQGHAWHIRHNLDVGAMQEAASSMTGTHDFTTFRHVKCQARSPIKTLDRLEVVRVGNEILVDASARSFLHNQVRSLVGSLVAVGEGRWQPDDMKKALAARDRAACAPLAPAHGLYLTQVDYNPPYDVTQTDIFH